VDKDEVLEYLASQIDLLQRKAIEISEQHDEIQKELNAYRQLVRMYRGVYESEAGVGLQNRLPTDIIKLLEEKLAEEETSTKKGVKKKIRRRRKAK